MKLNYRYIKFVRKTQKLQKVVFFLLLAGISIWWVYFIAHTTNYWELYIIKYSSVKLKE